MNYFLVSEVSAFSILIPAVACAYRRDRFTIRYFPLAIVVAIGLLNEIVSYFLIRSRGTNMANSNIYTLIEVLLMLWLFYRWHRHPAKFYIGLGLIMVTVWLLDVYLVHSITQENNACKMASFLLLTVLSMDRISYLMTRDASENHKTDILLAFTFFTYFAYKGFIMVFALFPIATTSQFSIMLWLILALLNIIVNFAITIAILWLPKTMRLTSR